MARQWSTGALVAVGLAAWIVGLGMGGRIMATYCVEGGLVRNRRRVYKPRLPPAPPRR